MRNKVVIVSVSEISYAGEICFDKFIHSGIVLKLSDKSDIKLWFPVNEIFKIVLPNATEVYGEDIDKLFHILEDFNTVYGFEV